LSKNNSFASIESILSFENNLFTFLNEELRCRCRVVRWEHDLSAFVSLTSSTEDKYTPDKFRNRVCNDNGKDGLNNLSNCIGFEDKFKDKW